MEQQTNSNTNQPALCKNGCGFFGNPSSDGMCSKCYKDVVMRKMAPPQSSSLSPAVNISSGNHGMQSSNLSSPVSLTPMSNGSSTSSSFLDLSSTSPVNMGSTSPSPSTPVNPQYPSMFSSSVPTHLTAHMPHASSAINVKSNGGGGELGADLLSTSADSLSMSPSSSSLPGSFMDSSPMGEKKKNRCAECNKKVGLTGFECRCGGMFCPVHRYSDVHKCSFDYKQMGADEIRKNNPAVRGEKVQKL